MVEFDRKEHEEEWRRSEEPLTEEQVQVQVNYDEFVWLLNRLDELGGSLERMPEEVLGLMRGLVEHLGALQSR